MRTACMQCSPFPAVLCQLCTVHCALCITKAEPAGELLLPVPHCILFCRRLQRQMYPHATLTDPGDTQSAQPLSSWHPAKAGTCRELLLCARGGALRSASAESLPSRFRSGASRTASGLSRGRGGRLRRHRVPTLSWSLIYTGRGGEKRGSGDDSEGKFSQSSGASCSLS